MRLAGPQRHLWPIGLLLIGLIYISPAGVADTIAQCVQLLDEFAANRPTIEEDVQQCTVPISAPSLIDICPQQVDALLQHPWSWGLARGVDDLVLADLTGLDPLYQRYNEREAMNVVNVAAVGGVLAALDLPAPEKPSWWQQAWRALVEWFRQEGSQLPGWFEHISISEFAVKTVMYVSMALIILMALGIVGAELRLGLANRRRASTTAWDENQPVPIAALGFEQLSRSPLREQPGLLLGIVLAQLHSMDVLQLRTSCTHRDITAATAALKQGDAVGEISTAAEQATFGDWCPAPEEMQHLLKTGRGVCESLGGDAR